MSFQVTLRSIACSHFIQAPCCRMTTALLVRSSSTEARTSSCTSLCLSFPLAELYRVALRLPSPALPCATVPRMALCFSRVSACWTASAAFHFLPVLTTIPAPDTLASLDPEYCRCSWAHATMNSSLTELKGAWACWCSHIARCYLGYAVDPAICVDSCSPFAQNLPPQSWGPHR